MRVWQTPGRERSKLLAVAGFALFALLGSVLIARQAVLAVLADEAETSSREWAEYALYRLPELSQAESSEDISAATTKRLQAIMALGRVFRATLAAADGSPLLQLSVDGSNAKAASAPVPRVSIPNRVLDERTASFMWRGRGEVEPPLYSQVYVPIGGNGAVSHVLVAEVDQSDRYEQITDTSLRYLAAILLLIGASLVCPIVLLWRRRKDEERYARRVHHLAHKDALTGLDNRASFIEAMDERVFKKTKAGAFAVHLIDLDRFKEINDRYGHDVGDMFLKTVSSRLLELLRPEDVLARLGGDEFAVLQSHLAHEDEALAFGEAIVNVLGGEYQLGKIVADSGASVGTAVAPYDGEDTAPLLKAADLAMYVAKNDGRGRVRRFARDMEAAMNARVQLELDLKDAFVNERFELYYQPQFDMAERALTGFEALLRLTHPERGPIPSEEFIPVAESIGLIDPLGQWIIEEACRTAAGWPEHLSVAINLSPLQFKLGDMPSIVRRALRKSKLAPSRLDLEVTESLLLERSDAVMRQLEALREMGVSIVMDDFGVGYSSLSHLWGFGFDKIKIDRTFVQALDTDEGMEPLLRSIVDMGRNLGRRVTAEGVENVSQARFLVESSCCHAQGYLFGEPLPTAAISPEVLNEMASAYVRQSDAA